MTRQDLTPRIQTEGFSINPKIGMPAVETSGQTKEVIL